MHTALPGQKRTAVDAEIEPAAMVPPTPQAAEEDAQPSIPGEPLAAPPGDTPDEEKPTNTPEAEGTDSSRGSSGSVNLQQLSNLTTQEITDLMANGAETAARVADKGTAHFLDDGDDVYARRPRLKAKQAAEGPQDTTDPEGETPTNATNLKRKTSKKKRPYPNNSIQTQEERDPDQPTKGVVRLDCFSKFIPTWPRTKCSPKLPRGRR